MFQRTKLVALTVGLVVFAYSAATFAANTDLARIAGKLTKIDGTKLTITAATENQTTTTVVTCNDATKINRDGDKQGVQKAFKDLQVGQEVRAYCTKNGNIAMHVHIAKPAASASNHK